MSWLFPPLIQMFYITDALMMQLFLF